MEVHFNTDNIDYIKYYPRHKSNYIWQPVRERTKFLWFFTDEREIEAGWGEYIHRDRVSPEWLLMYNYIYVPDKNNKEKGEYHPSGHWDKRAYVYVKTKETDHGRHFDTNEGAEAWIRTLEVMSGATFAVIKDK